MDDRILCYLHFVITQIRQNKPLIMYELLDVKCQNDYYVIMATTLDSVL